MQLLPSLKVNFQLYSSIVSEKIELSRLMQNDKIYTLLEAKYKQYNTGSFIEYDPISIPHLFSKKQDIEIAGLFAATLAWGQRKTIITNAKRIMNWMDNAPHDFVINHQPADLKRFLEFKHRTFNATDTLYFIHFLNYWYAQNESLESAFVKSGKLDLSKKSKVDFGLTHFHTHFFSLEDAPHRTKKHVSTPLRKSTCKRLNMYLRWMVRTDKTGVDFGIWKAIKPAQLLIPLDVHVDRVARKLGLIIRKQTDWETVLELTEKLKTFDPKDPVKYDFALFGMGVMDKAYTF